METTARLDSSPLRILGWAAFLGASWTWVIGMYLPVLLVREWGLWGWIVFALPNVIGAAAMGAVLLTAERSRKLLSQHLPMATAFSIVTVAFHVFFIAWMLPVIFGADSRGLAVTSFSFVLAGVFYAIGGRRRDLPLAGAVLLVSLTAMAVSLTQPLDITPLFVLPEPRPDLLALTPVCMFGFFLCPYLDLTFHRARQSTAPAAGRTAFRIGFGVLFLAMIIFTLLYARWLNSRQPNEWLRWAVGVHLLVQIAFTMAVHTRSLVATERSGYRASLLLATIVALALGALTWRIFVIRGLDSGEVIYRCFMGFYGLIFPAYVWLCMIPKGPAATPGRGLWIRFAIAVTAALPFFWLGFVERQYWWLLAGLGIVLGMRWTIRANAS